MIIFSFFIDDDLSKIHSRDPLVFKKIFKEYSEEIYTYLMIKTSGDEQLCGELFSDTFHSALVSAPKINYAKL